VGPESRRGPILVVAAWAPELAWLRGRTRALRGDVVIRTLGVGLVEAAVATARLIAQVRPREVVMIGTAGRYPGNTVGRTSGFGPDGSAAPAGSAALAIGRAVIVRRLHLVCDAVLRGDAYWPAALPRALATDVALRRALATGGLAQADAACPLAITHTATGARRAGRQTGCTLETLEAFAVGRAVVAAGVPFACVLGISNVVGPAAHAQWKAHAAVAAAAACEVVLSWLRAPTRL